MKIISKMLIRAFVPVFLISLAFFVMVLELVDLFSNLWRYYNNDVPILKMLEVAYLYIPKCIIFSLPIALLFSISFTLGAMYSNNELIAILGAGISFYQLVFPLIVVSILLAFLNFWFNDSIVTDSYAKKVKLYNALVRRNISLDNRNVTVISDDNRVIYFAGEFRNDKRELLDLLLIFLNRDGSFLKRIDARRANWEGSKWVLYDCSIYEMNSEDGKVVFRRENIYRDPMIKKEPCAFKVITRKVDEMSFRDALEWVRTLKKAGLPYREALTNLYKKISFSLTPIIVALLAASIGSTFKKNVLLMSLIAALSVSVVYYASQMFFSLLAKNGYIPPVWGAWFPFFLFLLISAGFFRYAKT